METLSFSCSFATASAWIALMCVQCFVYRIVWSCRSRSGTSSASADWLVFPFVTQQVLRDRRWGNGPRSSRQASCSLATALFAWLAACLPAVVPHTDGVAESGMSPLQASRRDDHGLLCRNRRVSG